MHPGKLVRSPSVLLVPWEGNDRMRKEVASEPQEQTTWAELGEVQALTAASVPNTAMVVTTDLGSPENVHPVRKKEAGDRLAMAASGIVYGKDVSYKSPEFREMKIEDGKASDLATWNPPLCALKTPRGGVTLPPGSLFRGFFERNAGYLLNSFSVDGIAECQEADGYVYAFDRDKPKSWEHGNYARSWFTQGMVEAGDIYPKAMDVMRRGQDWFNWCEWLPDLIYLPLGLQGHPANLSVYFSPVGKPEDVQVAEKYYVQDARDKWR